MGTMEVMLALVFVSNSHKSAAAAFGQVLTEQS